MKVTTLSFEFDGRDEQEVINVTKNQNIALKPIPPLMFSPLVS